MKGYTGFTNIKAKIVDADEMRSPGLTFTKKIGTIKYNSKASGTALKLGTIPKGATIISMMAQVKTAFNAATTNVIVVGTATDDDAYMGASAITEGTIGAYASNVLALLAADTDIYAKYTQSGTAATTGEADIYATYML